METKDKQKKKNRSKFDPTSSYVVETASDQSYNGVIGSTKESILELIDKVDRTAKRKRELKELGLEEDFNPKETYVFKSQKQGIRTWKDFLLVYFMMILSISAFVSILVYFGYLENPLLKFIHDPSVTPRQIVAIQPFADDDLPNFNAPRTIELIEPTQGEMLTGKFVATGSATASFLAVKIEVYDDRGIRLGESTGGLTGIEPDLRSWTTPINLQNSPSTTEGYILVFPISEGVDSDLTLKIPIRFAISSAPKISMIGPIRDQISNDTTVIFRGTTEYEGPLRLVLTGEIGNEIGEYVLPVEDGKIDTAIVIGSIAGLESSFGNWRIYDEGNILLEIPVRFQPM
ncbi:hypothetical protein H6763_02310 [Candidatus Nomurabacteria bacterium]|uniref:Bacterial spore germination immunoglobulin-like domain-containing protein n=1 Tax=Candidatus Dojkabacteria bacterium TaxID=2099670 RepID=A0A955KXS0_9BACT|nr:hypothetical protein [Candidatus Dojkabacteria bacterium]MCB9790363.1 hypothetical protein [Candidatus Nomurabacteria bacterium]MCB9803640.1 hypothetical protein [Candidatus Nomurabacteria bacterium]